MTVTLRPARERGHARHGWLESDHSFSFADYFDPAHMGFRGLRVINEDVIQPGSGFAEHGHRDMEILTYVLRGTLTHRDSTGAKGVLRHGDVQYMSAGTGIRHSEVNESDDEPVHLLQIWILPPRTGLAPSYQQRRFAEADLHNVLRRIAGPDDDGTALRTHRDARIHAARLDPGVTVSYPLGQGRGAWVQVVEGAVDLDGTTMGAGDGAAVDGCDRLTLTARDPAEILLFDLD